MQMPHKGNNSSKSINNFDNVNNIFNKCWPCDYFVVYNFSLSIQVFKKIVTKLLQKYELS